MTRRRNLGLTLLLACGFVGLPQSRAIAVAIANPSFEDTLSQAWVYSENDPNGRFSGGYSTAWSSDGAASYLLSRGRGFDGGGGWWGQIQQSGVNLTGVTSLLLDVHAVGLDGNFLRVYVDTNLVSQFNVPTTTFGGVKDLLNKSIDVSANPGIHSLTIRMASDGDSSPADPKLFYLDNIRTIPGISVSFGPPGGATLLASATANNGTLAQAAALFPNATSFNWVQKMTFPSADTVSIVSPTLGTYQVSNTVTDPAIEPGSYYSITRQVNGVTMQCSINPPWYSNGFYYPQSDVNANSSTLPFSDTPSLPYWAFNENAQGQPLDPANPEFLQFTTQLVGVSASGSEVDLTGVPNTGFWWDDNAATVSSIGYLDTTPTNTPIISGGVFNIQAIPEPSTLFLLLSGGAVLIWTRRRGTEAGKVDIRHSPCGAGT